MIRCKSGADGIVRMKEGRAQPTEVTDSRTWVVALRTPKAIRLRGSCFQAHELCLVMLALAPKGVLSGLFRCLGGL